ncbi:TonB family protein [Hymenobacter sp. 15J16-1T3B]|uniref:energy transducer TonB n=1 Tax=Hymenobacter sp. 15J16-1T3B TaxID=2886941 RepID=UPI001D10C560|nr:energy transducer TonB [Hymenobacter sp. 15J16-1T3B]MCC3155701.1 TonB family protein [Hymenobacter sp. 15J16-1T3B]
MTPLHLRPSTLDEIVFEGRNKAYGAFDLRQSYPTHVRRAVGLALLLFVVLAFAPSIVRRLMPEPVAVKPPVLDTDHDFTQVNFKPIDEPKPVTPPATGAKVPTVATPTLVVPDAKAKPRDESVTPPANAMPGAVNEVGLGEIPNDGNVVPGDGTGKQPLDLSTPASSAGKTDVFITAEVMPAFEGGDAALVDFLRRNMRYPATALREQIEGKVFVSFTVSATGEIVDVQVLKGLGYGTDEEALRVVRKMPAWKPGVQNGHAVAVRYTLPITFRIGN